MGMPKALLDLGGRPAVVRAVDVLREGGCAEVVVVTGAEGPAVHDVVSALGPAVRAVHNPAWAEGMGTSLRVGIDALGDRGSGVVVHLVDLPDVGPDVVRRLVAAAVTDPTAGHRAWAAAWGGRRGNPVLLDHRVLADVADVVEGDRGARGWLDAHAEQVVLVPCDDLGDGADVDTPEQLAAWQALGTRP